MCLHSSSATVITKNISGILYPRIRAMFPLVKRCSRETFISKEATDFYKLVDGLKREFDLLSQYEESRLFPAVIEVFDTKHEASFRPSANITQLQKLVQANENVIKELVEDIEIGAEELGLPSSHAVFKITTVFKQEYMEQKEKWYNMLEGWNTNCSCFIRASTFILPGKEETVFTAK